MKVILILCVLQMIFLAFLANRLIHIEDQLNQVDSNSALVLAGATTQLTDESQVCSTRDAGLDERKLRRIIRSELDVMSNAWLEVAANDAEPAADPIEDARRLDAARQTLGYYIKGGEISDIEMQEFQTEISRLEPESRTMLLRALVHALNSGDLKGRL